ncbi:Chaperone protein ClpB1 [Forsythia ovata]|uniref:Chaperone protein ClpB1 n=1 Tax=Forsythia ovata TaxID=205694 RepID=A0ABD1X7M1_9LAMI
MMLYRGGVQQVSVPELGIGDIIRVLKRLKERFEGHHSIIILDRALDVAAKLSSRYLKGRQLSEKRINLIDEACANVRVKPKSLPDQICNLERKLAVLEDELRARDAER